MQPVYKVTTSETVQDLINLLIEGESLFQPEKLQQISTELRSRFRAREMLILSIKGEQVQMLRSNNGTELQAGSYRLSSFAGSHFLEAGEANQVQIISDLRTDHSTELERRFLEEGMRSLLLIPLILEVQFQNNHPHSIIVLVGLSSDRPEHFTYVDAEYATQLIPALRSSLRQAVQGQFTHIHPAVEWHFIQEAQRRTMGLPPEPIVFQNVYPLYGISDIRGSSEERNRAIQEDLLQQFDLALGVIEAVNQTQVFPLLQQLRLDFLDYIDQLHRGVTVEDEVGVVMYLREHLEIYFDYFQDCSDATAEAVARYRQSCDPEQGCVYTARNRYDQMIHQINSELRRNWESWQVRMQAIIPHYCDEQVTDGIDHMIYVGSSIHSQFSIFHLHCLRYEQLRAMGDNARMCFELRDRFNFNLQVSHLVLIQNSTVDIFHDEQTEKLFDVQGTRDTRYEIVKKRIDKAVDAQTRERITQPGMLTVVYASDQEKMEYEQYFRYLAREGWIDPAVETGDVEMLQGIAGLRYSRVQILPA